MSNAWINRYRPNTFDDVIGHDAVVRSLEGAIAKGNAQAFLFTGPSGVGKTTLARIVANELGCGANRLEIDAATNTGIEAMREVTSGLEYMPLSGDKKAIIVDEAHALSKAASQALLKILEEPPEWVYWFLCTTEETRILPTLKTRCFRVELKPLPKKQILELLNFVASQEKLKLPTGVKELCAEEALGSPRQALSYLAACASVEDLDEARELIGSASGSPEAVDLARLLMRRGSWREAQELLKELKDTDPESIRRVIQAYLTSVITNAKSENDAGKALEILENFLQPFYHNGGLVFACGKTLLS